MNQHSPGPLVQPVTFEQQQEHPSAAKAWCLLDGTGTIAILASYNVTSLFDNGTGNYDVNLTTAMSGTDYAVVAAMADDRPITANRDVTIHAVGETASIININCFSTVQIDINFVSVSAFGDQ